MSTQHGSFEPATYKLPIARLHRLSRAGSRKLYPARTAFTWMWILGFLAFFVASAIWVDVTEPIIADLGQAVGLSGKFANILVPVLGLLIFFTGLIIMKRRFRAAHRDRFGIEGELQISPADGGVKISNKDIEYRIRGAGIYRLLRERDGIVIVVGGLMFLVPNDAFKDADNWEAFIEYVSQLLTVEARERSAEVIEHARKKP